MNRFIQCGIRIIAIILCLLIGTEASVHTLAKTKEEPWTKLSDTNYSGSSYSATIGDTIYSIAVLNSNSLGMEAYDTKTGEWTKKKAPNTKRIFFTLLAVDKKLYILGGFSTRSGMAPVKNVEVYDPTKDKWTEKTSAPSDFSQTAVVNKKIYCIGNQKIYEYNPVKDIWKKKNSNLMERYGFGVAVLKNKIYIIGGMNKEYTKTLNDVEVFDIKHSKLSVKSDLAKEINYPTLKVIGEKIYVLCGTLADGVTGSDATQVYNPDQDKWSLLSKYPNPRADLNGVVVNDKVYIIGGWDNGKYVDKVEEYSPASDTWTIKTPMPCTRNYLCATVVNEKIYVFGGCGKSENDKLKSVYSYDPTKDE